ncbi:hypothetical protein [Bacillus sp. AFS031507]|uniref:hypothetical protein n=1 Tax=Bacillus sp. AFS031507 TaxID=2033496 RepID=UPI000BFB6D10|nr:hypothetical protein [Bacillus sp. AFS031507]PGY06891.1 hypothetical protein COE25_26075 [Bacillus sp. AFS031507]
MAIRLRERKFVPILLGFLTALALFIAVDEGIESTMGDILFYSYLVIPVVLLLLGIYQFKKKKNKQFLIYTISVISAVIVIPFTYPALLFVIAVSLHQY